MNKFEKQIAKNSKYVDNQISKFASAIDETKKAIESHNETIKQLELQKREVDRLISVTETEKERANKFLNSMTSLIK